MNERQGKQEQKCICNLTNAKRDKLTNKVNMVGHWAEKQTQHGAWVWDNQRKVQTERWTKVCMSERQSKANIPDSVS